ncbi:MAG: porin family protein [Bacteroidota bacterium]
MRQLAVVAALILITVAPKLATAQQQQKNNTTCAQTLRLARSVYENGRLHELEGLLEGCVKADQWTTQERVDAYKLLTLAYIYMEEPEKADAMMLSILQTDPEFRPNNNIDPAEFVALWSTFRTEPVFRLGVKVGANATQPNVHQYTPTNEGSESYKYGYGFQAGVSAEIGLFNGKFVINPELYFQSKSFKINNSFFEGGQTTTGTASMKSISLPVSVQYPLPFGQKSDGTTKWTSYVGLGLATDFLLSVKTDLETDVNDQSPIQTTNTEKGQYKLFNFAPILSAGVKWKVKKAEIVTEVRFNYGASTIFNKQRLYDSQSEVFGNKFVHGPFSLNTLSLSAGYLLNKYIPKKKTSH